MGNLIINGVDFGKKLDQERRRLHYQIEYSPVHVLDFFKRTGMMVHRQPIPIHVNKTT